MTSRRVFLATLAFASAAAVVAAGDFNGEWTASIETQIGVQNYTFSFKVDGEILTGRAKSAFANADTEITEGVVKGDDITFPDGKKLFIGSEGTGAPDEKPGRGRGGR